MDSRPTVAGDNLVNLKLACGDFGSLDKHALVDVHFADAG
jgi:hypothetical protein